MGSGDGGDAAVTEWVWALGEAAMKFVCDRCSTRYSISDDKVRGKVLKIRCKTCSNIIVVREPSVSAAPMQAQAAAGGAHAHVLRGPAPTTSVNIPIPNLDFLSKPAPANTEWWVAIKGSQHGPMKRDGVERLFDEGRISARSYCWHSQMPAWMRLQELPDFAHLANRQPGTAPVQAVPPPPAGELVDLQKARAERAVSAPSSPAAAPSGAGAIHDPFAAAAAASGPLEASAKPGEATRVFIMQAGLANRKAKHRTYAVSAVVGLVALVVAAWGDWTGRWEIPGLHSALSYAAETTGVEVPQQRLLASWDDVKPDMEEKCVLNPGAPDCQRYFAEKAAYLKKQRAKSKPAKGSDNGEIDLDGAFQKGPSDTASLQRAGVGSGAAAVDPFASNAGEASSIAGVFAKDGRKKSVVPVGLAESGPAVSGGTGPDAAAISTVVKDNADAVRSCIEEGSKQGSNVQGKHYLVLTIEPKGIVSNARFKNGVVNASPTGECIRKRARKWKFPAFVGEAADVEIPYILSAGM